MKNKLRYEHVAHASLAAHLEQQTILQATTDGGVQVYHCQNAQGESLAIALASGENLIVRLERPSAPLDRRRMGR
ncbi:hypothetical protein [Azonexus sp.]|uniref:hypothetical protein n=1 Tax=Azonexus sp. TaxID=1872668 RepID=UPI0039E53BF5